MTADKKVTWTVDGEERMRMSGPYTETIVHLPPPRSSVRAALVEKVARAMEKADSHAYEYQLTSSWEHLAEAAIDLIRADVLEEAARCAEMMSGSVRRGNIADALYIPPTAKEAAAAIRALKEKP